MARHVIGRFPARQQPAAIVEARRRLLHDEAFGLPCDLPGQLLSGYYRDRQGSPLRRLIETANRPLFDCETVLVVAPADVVWRGRAMLRALAHPYYELLDHGGRGGRPRVFFLEPAHDDDLLQGTLDLVRRSGESVTRHDRWALVTILPVVDEDGSLEVVRTAAPCFAALREVVASDDELRTRAFLMTDDAARRQFPDAAPVTLLPRIATATLWDGAALLTAALVGADVVGLVKGMIWFQEDARKRSPEECPIAQLAAFVTDSPVQICSWHHALDGLAEWLAEGLGGYATVVAAYRHAERRSRLINSAGRRLHLACDVIRRDRLKPNAEAGYFVPEALFVDGVPTPLEAPNPYDSWRDSEIAADIESAEIRLTKLNEVAIGELSAWLSAAKLLRNEINR